MTVSDRAGRSAILAARACATGVVIAGAITARRVRALWIRFMRLSSEAVIKVRVILAPAHTGNAERSIHAEFEVASAFRKFVLGLRIFLLFIQCFNSNQHVWIAS